MKTEHLSTTSTGWPAMWDALRDITGDYADCNPASGECWQYLGTYDGVHQFRHRHRPTSAQAIKDKPGCYDRVYINLDAETLAPVAITFHRYHDIPAGIADSRAIDERTAEGRDANRSRVKAERDDWNRQEYGGAFDGINVISDADPGL